MTRQESETETQLWIRKLEEALRLGRRLEPVTGLERMLITHLMVAAERLDLAMETYRLIPTLAGGGQPRTIRQLHEESKTTLTPST